MVSLNLTPPRIQLYTFGELPRFTIKVPNESLDLYKIANYWYRFVSIMEGIDVSGIDNIYNNDNTHKDKIFNLQGVKVNSNYKGVVIKNGKKVLGK